MQHPSLNFLTTQLFCPVYHYRKMIHLQNRKRSPHYPIIRSVCLQQRSIANAGGYFRDSKSCYCCVMSSRDACPELISYCAICSVIIVILDNCILPIADKFFTLFYIFVQDKNCSLYNFSENLLRNARSRVMFDSRERAVARFLLNIK